MFSRRPDAILNAQFWAEDGKLWYADAYNSGGFSPFLEPVAGYYQTVSRAAAYFAQIFPLVYAPLIFNLIAISVKILVVNLLLSSRSAVFSPKLSGRIFLAFIYIALPHSSETHANLTNVQWHLALLSCLIILVAPSSKIFWKLFDLIVITVSALSGPFCLLLFPIAVIKFWQKREKWLLWILAILFVGCVIQATALLSTQRPTESALGADIVLFFKIIGGHVFLSSIIGERLYQAVINYSLWKEGTVLLVSAFGIILLGYAFLKSNLELRLLIVFSALVSAAALISPAITQEFPQWEVMWIPNTGIRYWGIPVFCFLTVLFYLAANAGQKVFKNTAKILLLLSLLGIATDWRYKPFRDLNFPQYAEDFGQVERGEEFVIPINPEWEMKLNKK